MPTSNDADAAASSTAEDKTNNKTTTTNEEEPMSKKTKLEESGTDDEKKTGKSSKSDKRDGNNNSNNKNDFNDMNWVCAECKEAECLLDPSAEQFLLCDGRCHRVFHYPCAGLSQVPSGDFQCKDCTHQRHVCAFCHEYGVDDQEVFACRKDDCGLFFHESCLALNNVNVQMVDATTSATATATATTGNKVKTTTTETRNPCSVEAVKDGDTTAPTAPTSIPSFVCPAHTCWTCVQKDDQQREAEKEEAAAAAANHTKKSKSRKRKKKTNQSIYQSKSESRLFRCLYCPWAFHLTCLPPTSRFHELAVLCHAHSLTHKLPDLDLSHSFQGSVEDKIDRKLLKLNENGSRRSRNGGRVPAGSNPFLPGVRGDRLHRNEVVYLEYLNEEDDDAENGEVSGGGGDSLLSSSTRSLRNPLANSSSVLSFCLPCDIQKEIHSKPPNYTHLHGNRYDPNRKPKKNPTPTDCEQCQCEGTCDEDCFNRMTLIECTGEGPNSNCRIGTTCGNRALGKRQFVKCKPQRERGKGWGLVILEDVPKGQLVLEYVGEVIDEKEKEHRLIEWSKEHPNDPNFYVMGLGAGWYLDARECANMSRFINHSCDPNCHVTTINVKGYKRNGIYTKQDMKAGDFLCYDYHFDTKQADKFMCRCRAKNCRGTMKGGGNGANGGQNKSLNWKEAKARYDNDVKTLAELNDNQVTSQVDARVPAAEQSTEFVSAGPQENKFRDTAVRNSIFLWRNATLGADFVSRQSRLESSATSGGTAKATMKYGESRRVAKPMDILSLIRSSHV